MVRNWVTVGGVTHLHHPHPPPQQQQQPHRPFLKPTKYLTALSPLMPKGYQQQSLVCCHHSTISTCSPLQDFWSTEKERVYLVGVTYKQQYQQQQQRRQQQQQRQSLFSNGSSSSTPRGGLGMTVSSYNSPWAAAGAEEEDGSSSSSSKQPAVSYSIQESLEELGRLAETAGLKVGWYALLLLTTAGSTLSTVSVQPG